MRIRKKNEKAATAITASNNSKQDEYERERKSTSLEM
jgi:hypothetical protein